MNLQITVPYQTCPFKCPFCIANDPTVQSAFSSLYDHDRIEYGFALNRALVLNSIKTVVLTGDTEPTLNMTWVENVVKFIRRCYPLASIEIQTRNYNAATLKALDDLEIDVVAISVHKTEQLNLVRNIKFENSLKRAVVVLNKEFDQVAADYTGFDQVTLKQIQLGNNDKINEWIKAHKVEQIADKGLLTKYPLISFMFDENCMDNADRYLIFREDGKVYADWATTQPM